MGQWFVALIWPLAGGAIFMKYNNTLAADIILYVCLIMSVIFIVYYRKSKEYAKLKSRLSEERRINISDLIAQGKNISNENIDNWKNKATIIIDECFSKESKEYKWFHGEKHDAGIDWKFQQHSMLVNLSENNLVRLMLFPHFLTNPSIANPTPISIAYELIVLEHILEENSKIKTKILDDRILF